MSILTKLAITSLLAFSFSSSALATENYDVGKMSAEEAFHHGKLLRAQFKNLEAREYLKYAADHGHLDSAYLFAMDKMNSREGARSIAEAIDYLTKAAEAENRSALKYMYRHGDWLSEAKRNSYKVRYYNSLVVLGATSPELAYLHLSDFVLSSDKELSSYYLEQAMEYDLPSAYMESAQRIENNDDDEYYEEEIAEQSKKQYIHAAEDGYLPAMKRYVTILETSGKFEEALEWREKALKQGDITSLVALGVIYSGKSLRYDFVEPDLIRAKTYFELYLENAGKDSLADVYKQAESNYKDIVDQISTQQHLLLEDSEDILTNVEYFYNHDYLWLASEI